MSDEVNRSQQQDNFPAFFYYGFGPFGFGSPQGQPVPFHPNQLPFRNYVPGFSDMVQRVQLLSSHAASEQVVPLGDVNAASSSRTANPSIDNALVPRENAALTQPAINGSRSPAMNFMHAQHPMVAPPHAHIGGFYYMPAHQRNIPGIHSPNAGAISSMNVQAAFNTPPRAIMPATPLESNANAGGLAQPVEFVPYVVTPSASPTTPSTPSPSTPSPSTPSPSTPSPSTPSRSPTAKAGGSRSTPKRHRCLVCDNLFARPSQLKSHSYSHTGERPFPCTVKGCKDKFTTKSNLTRHMKSRVHRNPGQGNQQNEINHGA
ncbi:hypothetical protein RUND412_002833 [Rhizina undulata]